MAEWGLRSRPMEMRRGSVRIVLAGLLLAACKSGGEADDPKVGEPLGGGSTDRGEFSAQGPSQGCDVASVRYRPDAVEVEFDALSEGPTIWARPLALAVDTAPSVVIHAATGEELDTIFDDVGLLYVRAPRVGTGTRHRIVLEFRASGDGGAESVPQREHALPRVAPIYPTDRGNVEVISAHRAHPVDEGAPSMPVQAAFQNVILADFYPRASRAGEPAATTSESDYAVALAAFCEAELLTRAPMGAAHYPGGPTAAWFGGMVAPVTGQKEFETQSFGDRLSPASDEPGHAVSALAAVLEGLYAETLPAADRPSQRLGDDAWAVPRYMALREKIGADAFREALREIVDRHRGGAPISFEEVAAVFRELSGDDAGTYVRTWLAGPARPVVRTQWRFDDERARLLLRINQVHEASGQVPAAYPIRIPLRVVFSDGSMQDHAVEVSARRSPKGGRA